MHTYLSPASNAAYEEAYLNDDEHEKEAADGLGGSLAVGAGSGALIGALASLLREKPSLKKSLQDALVGGTAGAAAVGGARALGGSAKPEVASASPSVDAPSPSAAKPGGMSLPLAALSGMIPGIGPAVHGAIAAGPAQAAGSAAASLIPPMLISYPSFSKGMAAAAEGQRVAMPGRVRVAAMLASILGSVGAAHLGNKRRETSAEQVA